VKNHKIALIGEQILEVNESKSPKIEIDTSGENVKTLYDADLWPTIVTGLALSSVVTNAHRSNLYSIPH